MSESGPIPVKEGDLLAGKYRVERVLGVGGMGIVVAARHEQLDQQVAIKFVREEALGNAEAVERFLREARAAVKLRSEHAAKVLDVGKLDSGAPYMVMEFLEGSDLAAVLAERGPLTPEVAAEYLVQACEAVAEAHAAGIIHRDLKPQNLFLARTVGGGGRVKVLDFGVSKSMTGGSGGLTQTRSMLGSPLYMSPEQMRSSRDVDARSDVWALGVVLFELLTQRWPFEAETMPELCLKVVTEPPQSLRVLRPDAPAALVEIIEHCLKKDPNERYANAAELASALEPLAPPESRVTIERARAAMGSTTRGRMTSNPGVASAQTPPTRTAPTPAAWGSGKGEAVAPPTEKRKASGAMWVGLGIVGAAAIAGAVVLLQGRGGASSAASPSPSAVAAPPPAVAVQAPAVAPAPSLAPAPAVTATETAAAAVAPSVAPSATPRPGATPPALLVTKPGGAPARNPASTAAPGSKPKATDDDIPSLR
ncbi:MAG TPA: serine/threonine-protein kinase [Polyangiaceae bacterium]|jgi:serine/threonine-protein kinase